MAPSAASLGDVIDDLPAEEAAIREADERRSSTREGNSEEAPVKGIRKKQRYE